MLVGKSLYCTSTCKYSLNIMGGIGVVITSKFNCLRKKPTVKHLIFLASEFGDLKR